MISDAVVDWSAISYTNSSFVLNYLKLYHSWLFSLFKALTTLTSLKSYSSTERTRASFPYNLQFDSRTSRSIAWDFAHLSALSIWLALLGTTDLGEDPKIYLEGLRWVLAYLGDSFSVPYSLLVVT